MARFIFTVFFLIAILTDLGCQNDSGKAPPASSHVIGDVKLYTFSADQEYLLSNAQPFKLPPTTLLKDALDRLGIHMAQNYFSKTYTHKKTDIHFEILAIHQIPTPSRLLRIAVINMVDKEQDAMGYFFQGSAGARTTFFMLTATFMQPHLNPPLLDGLVFLYNGEILQELDHINLTGMLTPRLVRSHTYRAIQSSGK